MANFLFSKGKMNLKENDDKIYCDLINKMADSFGGKNKSPEFIVSRLQYYNVSFDYHKIISSIFTLSNL